MVTTGIVASGAPRYTNTESDTQIDWSMKMRVKNVAEQDVRTVVENVSRKQFDGNIVLENVRQVSKNVVTFKLGAQDSRGAGARKSASGRHGRWACTHVFEAVMLELVRSGGMFTGLTTGVTVDSESALDEHVDRFNCSNVGSLAAPAYMEQLCVSDACFE